MTRGTAHLLLIIGVIASLSLVAWLALPFSSTATNGQRVGVRRQLHGNGTLGGDESVTNVTVDDSSTGGLPFDIDDFDLDDLLSNLDLDDLFEDYDDVDDTASPTSPAGSLKLADIPYELLTMGMIADYGFFNVFIGTPTAIQLAIPAVAVPKIFFEIPASAIGETFLIEAMAGKGNGEGVLMNMPLSSDIPNWFQFEVFYDQTAPDPAMPLLTKPKPLYLDLNIPNLDTRYRNDSEIADSANNGLWKERLLQIPILRVRPDNGAYLIDATAWVMGGMTFFKSDDFPCSGWECPGTYLDDPQRLIKVRSYPHNVELEVEMMAPGADETTEPQALSVHYSIIQLPEAPMTPRVMDDRIGYFGLSYLNLDVTAAGPNHVRLINKWRLEPSGNKTEDGLDIPVRKITYHIDPSIPQRWRKYFKKGVELWNKAFAAAGWKDPVRALTPEDADWPVDYDAGDSRYSSISWVPSLDAVYAEGPSWADPRTGELLNADIIFAHGWVRSWSQDWSEEAASGPSDDSHNRSMFDKLRDSHHGKKFKNHPGSCGFRGHDHDHGHADAILAALARDEWDPDVEGPEEFIGAALVDTVAHEVGHTLGLRHNFKGSAAIPFDRLHDKSYTAVHGITASVMDYCPLNVSPDREHQGHFFTPTVGDYDVWAIQYGYKHIEDEVPGVKHPELDELASLSGSTPFHRFATDSDTPDPMGIDPYVNTWDLSDDPLRFYEENSNFLFEMLESGALFDRSMKDNCAFEYFNDAVGHVLRVISSHAKYSAKFIGGHNFSKAPYRVGVNRHPVEPVEPATVRRAIALIISLITEKINVSPEVYPLLVSRLNEEWGHSAGGDYSYGFETVGVHEVVHDARKVPLYRMFEATRLDRVLDSSWALGEEGVSVYELVETVHNALLSTDETIITPKSTFDENLQTEWVDYMIYAAQSEIKNAHSKNVFSYFLHKLEGKVDACLSGYGCESPIPPRLLPHFMAIQKKAKLFNQGKHLDV